MQKSAHCHILVATTAQENCRLLYGALMSNNAFYAEWKRQHPGASAKGLEKAFVAKFWSRGVEVARATLAHMLTLPLEEDLKSTIAEALILDNTLIRGRASASTGLIATQQ